MGLNKKGFTLLELIIYIGLLTAISLVMVSAFLGLSRAKGGITARTEVNSNLRFAVEKINQDIKDAGNVGTPASPGGTTSSSLVVTTDEGQITYCISDGRLRRQVTTACNGASPVVTSDKVNVSALTFTRFQNTNSVLAQTVVTIQTSITIDYISSSPGLDYSSSLVTIQSSL